MLHAIPSFQIICQHFFIYRIYRNPCIFIMKDKMIYRCEATYTNFFFRPSVCYNTHLEAHFLMARNFVFSVRLSSFLLNIDGVKTLQFHPVLSCLLSILPGILSNLSDPSFWQFSSQILNTCIPSFILNSFHSQILGIILILSIQVHLKCNISDSISNL